MKARPRTRLVYREPIFNAPITFWLSDPGRGGEFVNGGVSITTHTDASGLASVLFTLGPSTGTYLINATCPADVCTSGARQVPFTATARGKALTCDGGICYLHGRLPWRFPNPFRVRVIDKLDGKPAKGEAVSYSVISFTDTNNVTRSGDNGARMSPPDTQTDSNGNSSSYFVPGPSSGTYVIQARCPGCLEGQEQILRAGVHTHDSREMPATAAGDPDANEDGCPSGCCPVTPVLRVKMVNPPNDGVSFTSAAGENGIGLDALVLPQCLEEKGQVSVSWKVEDAPGDYMYSGTPKQPNPGPISSFVVGSGTFPVPTDIYKRPIGRPLPLAYKVTASITRNGETTQASAETRQDEINKCRQEYIDLNLPQYGNPIPQRSGFRIGLDQDFAQNVKDCFAFIYPERAEEAFSLKKSHPGVTITGAYRSPRKNLFLYLDFPRYRDGEKDLPSSVWKSRHMFGDAIDLTGWWGKESAAEKWGKLWEAANPPKIFEWSGPTLIMNENGRYPDYVDVKKYPLDFIYKNGHCLHLGY